MQTARLLAEKTEIRTGRPCDSATSQSKVLFGTRYASGVDLPGSGSSRPQELVTTTELTTVIRLPWMPSVLLLFSNLTQPVGDFGHNV